jgi:dihydropteroate synthase-like protein
VIYVRAASARSLTTSATLTIMPGQRVILITGKLAEPALRRLVAEPAIRDAFEPVVVVLPITVIALATTRWIADHLPANMAGERLVVPGLCTGELEPVTNRTAIPAERGPAELSDLPMYFGLEGGQRSLGQEHDIEILAEINGVERLSITEILKTAETYRSAGADVIDLGCSPGQNWSGAEPIRQLRRAGFRVSIDSFDSATVETAIGAGAELVLSVNSSNVGEAHKWGCEVVAIPDSPADLPSLERTVSKLEEQGVRYRLDPIIEPIGCGFAASLGRYLQVRERFPNSEILMGVGNITELTDVDSAGINVLLAAFCQDTGIRSVLTTQVINWCRSAIRELDVARRLVFQAVAERMPPKNLSRELLLLRDDRLRVQGRDRLNELAGQITDPNFRIFAENDEIHIMSRDLHLAGKDPFELFRQIQARTAIDPAHAFYLGSEMARAAIALKLGKNYIQDRGLSWGLLGRDGNDRYNGSS